MFFGFSKTITRFCNEKMVKSSVEDVDVKVKWKYSFFYQMVGRKSQETSTEIWKY